MKKAVLVGLSCLVVMSASLTVQAHCGGTATCSIGGCNLGECFMDYDGDGICGDHCFIDEDGDGICDNHCYTDADCNGICDSFYDDDLDGICDHCHEHGKPVYTQSTTTRRSYRGGCHGGGHHRGHCQYSIVPGQIYANTLY